MMRNGLGDVTAAHISILIIHQNRELNRILKAEVIFPLSDYSLERR